MSGVPGTLQQVHRKVLQWFDENHEVIDKHGNAVVKLSILLDEADIYSGTPDSLRKMISTLVRNDYLSFEMFSQTKVRTIKRTAKVVPTYSKNAEYSRKASQQRRQLEKRVERIEEILKKDLGIDF